MGALGRHHTRILNTLPGVELVGIFDTKRETAEAVATEHGAKVAGSFDELAGAIDIAVLAVPTVLHAELGVDLLGRGIHLLVEKPIAASLAEADRLIEAAARAKRVLAVGHVEFHNPAVQALVTLDPKPRFLEVERLGVFSPRSLDVDVILDLMIHDLQIVEALDPSPVAEIRATGIAVLSNRIDMVNARVALESGLVANLTASRVSSERVRKLRAFCHDQYFSVDYPTQEIKGYRLVKDPATGPRIEPAAPPVEKAEPLVNELSAYVRSCRGEPALQVDGPAGRRALAVALDILDAARA